MPQIIIEESSPIVIEVAPPEAALQAHALQQGRGGHIPDDGIGDSEIGLISQSKVDGLTQELIELRALAGEGGTASSEFEFQRLNVSQSPEFQLTKIPTLPQLTVLTVQSLKQSFGIDFVIDGSILRWLGFPLKPEWTIEVLYK